MKIPLLFLSCSLLCSQLMAADLTVNISNIEEFEGNIHIGLFLESSDFPESAGQWQGKIVSANQTTVNTTFTHLLSGDYAVAVFQDLNNNQALDTNFFGIPKEPYGFSGGNPAMGTPDFAEAKFSLTDNDHSIEVVLK